MSPNYDLFQLRNWFQLASDQGVQVSIALEYDMHCRDSSANIVVMGLDQRRLEILENYMLCQRPADSILILLPNFQNSDYLHSFLKSFPKTKSVYLLDGQELHHLTTIRNQEILIDHESVCSSDTSVCKKKFDKLDFKGAKITASTLTWEPWLTLTNCGAAVSSVCESHGILANLMNILAGQYNFTWEVSQASHWGTLPDTGNWEDPNATFSGSLGSVINGEFDVPLSIWAFSSERFIWTDITLTIYDRPMIIVINNQVPTLDLTLLFRPFTISSWISILLTLLLATAGILVPQNFLSIWQDTWISHRIVVLSTWLMFILLNSFYGGALTMFFASAPNFPFDNLREGMTLWPDWKMLSVNGNEFVLERKLGSVLEAREYLDYVATEQGKKDLILSDIQTTLEKLTQPGYFLFETEEMAMAKVFR